MRFNAVERSLLMKLLSILLLTTAALSGCVVAPAPPRIYAPRPVVMAPPPPAVYVPPGVVYVAPGYPAPAHGYHWSHHPGHGWGYRHPDHGWHRGWR